MDSYNPWLMSGREPDPDHRLDEEGVRPIGRFFRTFNHVVEKSHLSIH